MPEALRLYGHPGLLAVAASINGDDFVPYNDAIFVKKPGLGASVGWHQDGATHWDSPAWHADIHGFNFQVQLHATTAASALWVVPGSHHHGKADIKAMVAANGGSDMLPDAVPLVCGAGDVTIANRQIVHGSFANSSPDRECRSPSDSTSEPPCSGSPASSGWPLLTPRSRLRRGANPASSNHPGCHRCRSRTCRTRHPSSISRSPTCRRLPVRGRDDRSGRDELQPARPRDLTTEPVGTIHAMPSAAAHHHIA